MKTLVVLLALFTAAPSAKAMRLDAFLRTATVTEVKLDSKLGRQAIRGGTIVYNLATKEVSFQLVRHGTCGFTDCSNLEWNVTLPIVSAQDTGCGFKIVAQDRRHDISHGTQTIELTDYSGNAPGAGQMVCMLYVEPGKEVVVRYTTRRFDGVTGRPLDTESFIYGTYTKRK